MCGTWGHGGFGYHHIHTDMHTTCPRILELGFIQNRDGHGAFHVYKTDDGVLAEMAGWLTGR